MISSLKMPAMVWCTALSTVFVHVGCIRAGGLPGGHEPDPLRNISYQRAFDQKKLYLKHRYLMQQLGCAGNIDVGSSRDACAHKEAQDSLFDEPAGEDSVLIDIQPDEKQEREKQIRTFTHECLKQLQSERRWAITEPARENLTQMALMFAGAGITNMLLPSDSFGGSMATSWTLMNAIFQLRDTIKSGYKLVYPPDNMLEQLEDAFARNRCFIPRGLWPEIVKKFVMARQNPFEQQGCIDFLTFALGLTVYKPKPALAMQVEDQLDGICQEVERYIDKYFSDYSADETAIAELELIKINVNRFLRALVDPEHERTPRYVYLHGPGGIGKTHFVNELSKKINELLPNAVLFQEMNITDQSELEGSPQRPGAFLRVLRNQLMAERHTTMLFMDEATWLNQFTSVSKRVFNGDQARLSTDYFGSGVEGAGIAIDMPRMLIFVASNDEIKDPALKSRFDVINFPQPTQEALVRHALNRARTSTLVRHKAVQEADLKRWIEQDNIKSFREVEARVEQFIRSNR